MSFMMNASANNSIPESAPLPNCAAQFTDSADANNSLLIHFFDLSSGNITNWNWDFGDGNYSSSQSPNHTYSTAGSYSVFLYVSDSSSSCFDSIMKIITVNANPNPCQAAFLSSVNPINKYLYSFTDQSQGNPYLWEWNFDDGSSSNNQNPSHTYSQPGTYNVSLKITTQSCVDTISQQITILPNSNIGSLLVYAFADSLYLTNSKLYLYQHDSINGGIQLIDSTTSTTIQGIVYYNFSSIPMGYYYVYAKILSNSPMFGNFYDTWMTNTIYSSFSDSILVNSNNIYTSMQMAKSTVSYPAGSSSIKGSINKKSSGTNLPLSNVAIYLLLNDSNIISKVNTNMQGEYEFTNLAFGTYYIHPEIIGKSTQNKKVILNYENPNEDSASFIVDGNQIMTGIKHGIDLNSSISIYPNPVKEVLYIQSNLNKKIEVNIQISDIQGRIVWRSKYDLSSFENKKINLYNLTKGLYFIKLQSKNTWIVKKIIKN